MPANFICISVASLESIYVDPWSTAWNCESKILKRLPVVRGCVNQVETCEGEESSSASAAGSLRRSIAWASAGIATRGNRAKPSIRVNGNRRNRALFMTDHEQL